MTKLETSAKKYDIQGKSGWLFLGEQTNGPHIARALLYTQDKTNPPSPLPSRGVMIPLFIGSESGSRIAKKADKFSSG